MTFHPSYLKEHERAHHLPSSSPFLPILAFLIFLLVCLFVCLMRFFVKGKDLDLHEKIKIGPENKSKLMNILKKDAQVHHPLSSLLTLLISRSLPYLPSAWTHSAASTLCLPSPRGCSHPPSLRLAPLDLFLIFSVF